MGFFCVDNLPTTLIPTFADLIMGSEQPIQRVALGVDVREGAYLSNLLDTIRELRARGHGVEVLFLEASEEALVRRYHETRRRHPLAGDGNALDGIRAERKALSDLREIADRILDTSALTVHQLKDRLVELYVAPKARPGLATSLVSFGFKHGVPFDADLVFDVRFLLSAPVESRPARWPPRGVRAFVLLIRKARRCSAASRTLKSVRPCYERKVPSDRHDRLHRRPPSPVTLAEELGRSSPASGNADRRPSRPRKRESLA
jgi:UPF0042 nucleotide-binding protein